MHSLLAASPYLGFEAPDMGIIYGFLAAIAGLLIALFILRGMGRLRERQQERKSAWRTFFKLAKARGLSTAQSEVLARATKRAKIKRPSQVLASVQVFDKCVNDFLDYNDVSSTQQAQLVAIRQKLVTKVEQWSKKQERRQLERVASSLPVQLNIVAKEWMDEELKSLSGEEDAKFRETFDGLLEGLVPINAQMMDISAGGMCLAAQEEIKVQEEDYIGLAGNVEILPIDINGLIGQVISFEQKKGQDGLILHIRFLAYEQELRRQIIQLVYEKQEPAKPKSRKPAKPKPVTDKGAVAGSQIGESS